MGVSTIRLLLEKNHNSGALVYLARFFPHRVIVVSIVIGGIEYKINKS